MPLVKNHNEVDIELQDCVHHKTGVFLSCHISVIFIIVISVNKPYVSTVTSHPMICISIGSASYRT